MNFAYSDEQEEFRATLRRFLSERAPLSQTRQRIDAGAGTDRALWRAMAQELGLQGIHLPEDCGGQGFGLLECGIVCEELGRELSLAPYFSTACLAAGAVRNAGTAEEQRRWLPELAGGAVGTLALLDGGDRFEPAAIELQLTRDGDAWTLDGHKRLVTDGAEAELLVVAARLPETAGGDGLCLAIVRGDAQGVVAKSVPALDTTRPLADIEFDGARAEPLGRVGRAGPALEKTLDQARVCLALEAAGGAERCLTTAVAYAKERVQFGQPIGAFQAIKHQCAEMLVEVESARSAAYWASWVAAEDTDELALAAATAKSFCDEAYLHASLTSLHIHGGIGVTWEADPHFYVKRAKANEILLGSPRRQRARIAEILGF